jgi:hypothetical protein
MKPDWYEAVRACSKQQCVPRTGGQAKLVCCLPPSPPVPATLSMLGHHAPGSQAPCALGAEAGCRLAASCARLLCVSSAATLWTARAFRALVKHMVPALPPSHLRQHRGATQTLRSRRTRQAPEGLPRTHTHRRHSARHGTTWCHTRSECIAFDGREWLAAISTLWQTGSQLPLHDAVHKQQHHDCTQRLCTRQGNTRQDRGAAAWDGRVHVHAQCIQAVRVDWTGST